MEKAGSRQREEQVQSPGVQASWQCSRQSWARPVLLGQCLQEGDRAEIGGVGPGRSHVVHYMVLALILKRPVGFEEWRCLLSDFKRIIWG